MQKNAAKREHRSLNNYVECLLMDIMYRKPNGETRAAIKEARSEKNLKKIDTSSFENFIGSCSEWEKLKAVASSAKTWSDIKTTRQSWKTLQHCRIFGTLIVSSEATGLGNPMEAIIDKIETCMRQTIVTVTYTQPDANSGFGGLCGCSYHFKRENTR